jgi:hypothetical protein
MAAIQGGSNTANVANVDGGFNLKTTLPVDSTVDVSYIGCVKMFAENDTGAFTGSPQIMSGETDLDFRQRSASDTMLDQEQINYTAQNTGKHIYRNTTMTNAWTVNGLQTNSSSITTTTTGTLFSTYAYFPVYGTSTLSVDMEVAFTAQPTSNTTIDFGAFLPNASNPYNPTDGAYFRLTSAGLQGVVNYNGTETATPVFPGFSYTNNAKLQFILYITQRYVEFWYNDGTDPTATYLLGKINTPAGNGSPCMASSLPVSIRHAIVGGAAGGVIQAVLSNYNVRAGGFLISNEMGDIGNRCYGSHQGLSGGTMGSLANYANSANPTAAVPTNTTAALGTGLGGQFWETDTLAVTTDGIICSFLNPAGTVNVAGRRLVINGVSIDSFVQTALTGGGYNAQFSLAFGHNALPLNTAEAATTKAPRRVPLGAYSVASGLVALTQLPRVSQVFKKGIYVNPGEYVQVVKKKIGTAPSAGVIAYVITFDYGWE